jgi:hypothetical protein
MTCEHCPHWRAYEGFDTVGYCLLIREGAANDRPRLASDPCDNEQARTTQEREA